MLGVLVRLRLMMLLLLLLIIIKIIIVISSSFCPLLNLSQSILTHLSLIQLDGMASSHVLTSLFLDVEG